MRIESPQNAIFRSVMDLKVKKKRDESGLFLVEGKKQIAEISENWNIKQFFISNSYKDTIPEHPKVFRLKDNLFNKLSSTKTPQGIIAIAEMKSYSIEKLIENTGLFVILENIQDPGNLGTIIRSADAFGVKAVFVSKESADIYSDKTIRSTMGSLFHIPVINEIDIPDLLSLMRKNSFKIYAASLNAKKSIDKYEFYSKSAILIGNEANGLLEETEKNSDFLFKIPMPGNAESLNAAVAASIIMYEFLKKYKSVTF